MKKVVLLGDSIRLLGYGRYVGEALGDDFSVWQSDINGGTTQKTLRMLFDYREQIKDADVVHWNNGHWDLCKLFGDDMPFTPPDIYERQLVRTAEILKTFTDKIIFATTTPVEPSYEYNDNKTICEYNEIAKRCLLPMGVRINDLYTAVEENVGMYISADKIHLTEEGAKACAELVSRAIKEIL